MINAFSLRCNDCDLELMDMNIREDVAVKWKGPLSVRCPKCGAVACAGQDGVEATVGTDKAEAT